MEQELRRQIIEATMQEISDNGFKFTMADVAKRIQISKKTIYTLFKDKNALFLETIDYGFAEIKTCEKTIIDNPQLSTKEKLKKVLIAMPDRFHNLDLRQIYHMKETYPKMYKKIEQRIEGEWEPTLELLRKGIEEGSLRPINIPVFKAMAEATIEHFLTTTILMDNQISYKDGLDHMLDILLEGISVNQ